MTARAHGTFEVKLTPQAPEGEARDTALGRLTIDKQFRGDLEATSRGQMLTGMTEVQGSAGYVAIERVSGTLQGHTGTFVLQHSGKMTRGAPQLTITVVPDSGTGELGRGWRGTWSSRPRTGSIRMSSSTRWMRVRNRCTLREPAVEHRFVRAPVQ